MGRPLFGLSTAHIAHRSPAEAIERCRLLGLDGVEFFTAEYTVSQCKEIRMLASDAGLSVDFHAAWDGSNDFGMTPPQKGFTHLEQALARTHLMGGRHLVVHLGRYDLDDPDGRRRALDRVIEITVRIVPALEDSRVLLCWEDNTLCHDLNPLGDQPEDFTRLFSAVQSEFVGMTLDTGHAHVTGYTRAYLEQFGNRVYYVHVNDNDGFGDLHIAPASGSIEWKGLMEQLAYYGASPCFGIEFNEQHVDFELPHLRALADALQWRG